MSRRTSSPVPQHAAGYSPHRPAWAGPAWPESLSTCDAPTPREHRSKQPSPQRAPCTRQEMNRSAMSTSQWPDPPPKEPRGPPPKAPRSTVEQQRSTHFAATHQSKDHVHVAVSNAVLQGHILNNAAGVPSRGGAALSKVAQAVSSVFGRSKHTRPPEPEQRTSVNPNSSASQLASSCFGTPRHVRPDEPEKAKLPNPNSKASQLASTSLPASGHARPAEPEKQKTARPNSHASQLSSTSLPQTAHAWPPPQAPRHRPAHALSSVAQNISHSHVFGEPRYLEPPPPGTLLSSAGDGSNSQCFAPGEWMLPTPRSARDGAPRTKAAMLASSSMPCTRRRAAAPPREREIIFPGDDPRLRVRRRSESAGDTHGLRADYDSRPHCTAEMQRSSVFGAALYTSPSPAVEKNPGVTGGWTKSGRNNSAVFPGQTAHTAPPLPAKEPKAFRAPASKQEQLESSSVGNIISQSPRKPSSVVQPSARSSAIRESFLSDAAGLVGTPRHSRAGHAAVVTDAPTPRNLSSAFDNSTAGIARSLAPSTKAAQQRSRGVSDILGTSRHESPTAAAKRLRDLNNPFLTNDKGFKRGPNSALEQQQDNVAHATGHSRIDPATNEQLRLCRSFFKIEFDGLPPEASSHRLHETLSALPYQPSITCARSQVKVQYGGLGGLATGKGEAWLIGVPDGEHTANAISEAQARGAFGSKGGRLAVARVKLDGRVRV